MKKCVCGEDIDDNAKFCDICAQLDKNLQRIKDGRELTLADISHDQPDPFKSMSVFEKFRRFHHYYPQAYAEKTIIPINLGEIIRFDPDLFFQIEEKPEECFKQFNHYYDDMEREHKHFVRLFPYKAMYCKATSEYKGTTFGKLVRFQGHLKSLSQNQAYYKNATYECRACGTIQVYISHNGNLPKPTLCKCGASERRAKLIEEKLTCVQYGSIVELQKNLRKDTQGKSLPFKFIHLPLNDEDIDAIPNSYIGKVVDVLAVLKKDSENIIYLDVHSFQLLDEEKISDIEREKITSYMAKNPDYFTNIAEHIFRKTNKYHSLKKALLYAAINLRKSDQPEKVAEGFHILLAGDKGTNKSQMVKTLVQFVPNSDIAANQGITYVGLCGGTEKNLMTQKPELIVGKLVTCDDGILMLDEMDKMKEDTLEGLNTMMSDGVITIAKYGIFGKFYVQTTIIACANPSTDSREFNTESQYQSQLDIPATIIDRCSLIAYMKQSDLNQDDYDKVLQLQFSQSQPQQNGLTDDICKSYIKLVKSIPNPIIPDCLIPYLLKVIKNIESKYPNCKLSHRRRKAIGQFARIIARSELKKEVEVKHINVAANLMDEITFKPEYSMVGTITGYGLVAAVEDANKARYPDSPSGRRSTMRNWLFNRESDEIEYGEYEHKCKDIGCDPVEIEKNFEYLKMIGDIIQIKNDRYKVIKR